MAGNRITGRETQKMQEYTQERIAQAERRGIEFPTDVKEQIFEYANLIGEEEKVKTLIRNLEDAITQADEEGVEDLLDDASMDIQELPDPTIGKLELRDYGYMTEDMVPLRKEAALDYHRMGSKIYCLGSDGSKGEYASKEMIQAHEGLFGMESQMWERIRDQDLDYADEDFGAFQEPMNVIGQEEALKLYDAGADIYLITNFSSPIYVTERMEIERGPEHYQMSTEELERIEREYHSGSDNIKPIQEFSKPEDLYDELIASIRKYHPSTDITLIEKAYHVAFEAHKGQVRKSGEAYIIHPLCVAIILAELELDKETIAAGLLHDVLEDTVMTEEQMREEFGDEVLLLVDGVTKLQHLHLTDNIKNPKDKNADRLEMQAENLRKMFLAMAKDIRVIMIKLADRLHNMRTLKYQSKEAQQRIARETQEIYCPIAQRLGISKIKIELEDLSLKYLEPEAYYDLVEKVALRKNVRDAYVQGLVADVRREIEEAGIKAEISGRAKHFFSIYKKMVNQNKTIDQIYDLFAIRIIVDTVKDCYAALGIMHEKYKPIPGRFKDYIAMPKPNMYQSLHTTLIGPSGQPFEIQIRTFEMHRTAEYGIAAHWKYKEVNNGVTTSTTVTEEEKLSWLRQILEWQRDMSDNKEFMTLLKSDLDLFSDTVFCFTPSGDVKNLPNGSTPIDFAYSIHSAVGNKMVGAKVNGKLVPIDYVIQNGDRIEVITSQNSKGPSRDWLSIVKSTQAKNKINQWFRSELKEENILHGKELINNYAKAKGINFGEINKPEYQGKIIRKYGFHDWNSCLATVGHGGLKESQIVNRMYDEYRKDHPITLTDQEVLEAVGENKQEDMSKHSKSGIVVKGLYDVAVHFSKCCSPVPGDEIVGFVTRGRGVSIHRTDCVNILHLSDMERVRLIEAEWQEGADKEQFGEYHAEIKIFCHDRSGLLVDITKVFTEAEINISGIHSKTSKQGIATIDVAFQTKGRGQITKIVEKIRQIESVMDVERTTG